MGKNTVERVRRWLASALRGETGQDTVAYGLITAVVPATIVAATTGLWANSAGDRVSDSGSRAS